MLMSGPTFAAEALAPEVLANMEFNDQAMELFIDEDVDSMQIMDVQKPGDKKEMPKRPDKKPHKMGPCMALGKQLTPDQKTAMKDNYFAYKKAQIENEAAMKVARLEFMHKLMDDASKLKDMEGPIQNIRTAAGDLQSNKVQLLSMTLLEVLKPEQKQLGLSCFMQMKKRHGKKGHARPGKGHGGHGKDHHHRRGHGDHGKDHHHRGGHGDHGNGHGDHGRGHDHGGHHGQHGKKGQN